MLSAKIICAISLAIALIGERFAHAAGKTLGEQMLLPSYNVHQRLLDINYDLTVLFQLYTRSTNSTPQELEIDDVQVLKQSNFSPTKKTLIVIHGFQSSANNDSASFQKIKNAALEFHDVNVIGVDWNYIAKEINYAWVASKVDNVGTHVSKFVEFLIGQGLRREDLHLIGHSLGAHVAGFAGKNLKAKGISVGRITGLDPAYPGFPLLAGSKRRLNSDDADFVDCIHTCGGKLGHPFPICKADFYPNKGGDVQPGCSALDFGTCSHGRAYEYFAESMNPEHLFHAKSCKKVLIAFPLDCVDKGALMGYPATAKFKGAFILDTNSKYPFSKNTTENPTPSTTP